LELCPASYEPSFTKGIFMSVLRSVTAAGLIALSLGGAMLTSAETANASPAGIAASAIAADAGRATSANSSTYGVYPVRYHHRRCFWSWRRDRWGHRHRVRICR
jgi:hypothetical protein